ncbi:uidA [Mytilus coruscus]|uniref:Beta-glucuronidase n=1 Tax=Mytilus coruscus TaxID=42192 RepID=A0A6J8A9T2_MYTCO|nr:uidA [Mytilus coruscus]
MVDRLFRMKTKSIFVRLPLLFIFFDAVRCDYFPTLYPRESETREIKELNGLWNFRADMSVNRSQGFEEKWFMSRLEKTGPVIPMPVPSSYNDVTQDKSLRDFTGWVWYDKEFFCHYHGKDRGSYTGTVYWMITTNSEEAKVQVEVVDADSNTVVMGEGIKGQASVSNVKLWWPYSMVKTGAAYMYVLKVTVKDSTSASTDIYRQPFGFRTVNKTNTQLLINNKPFYCHGVAKHEDYDLRGKGLDMVSVAKDFNILKWLGVNCFRTSHYPYAEEIMDQADQQGIVVIDESPAIGLLQQVYNLTKALDPTRLVTFASSNSNPLSDHVMNIVDVVMVNIYFGWYQDTGYLQTIPYQVPPTLEGLYKHYNKPVMVSEYGAETLTGLHTSPSFTFSEEYQKDLLIQYHQEYDKLRHEYLAGEMIWNFADFLIDQKTNWAYGCNKGLFTRHRQPKMAAFTVRERYQKMINETQKYQN